MKYRTLKNDVGAGLVISRIETDLAGAGKPCEAKKSDLLAEFILSKYPNELTQKAVIADLRQFALWLHQNMAKDLFGVKAPDLGLFRKHLETIGYKVASINRKLSSLKAFYRYLHEAGVNPENIAQYFQLIKNRTQIGSTPAFEQDQLRELFDSFNESKPNDLRDKVIVAIAFFCAARVSAILNLTFDDVIHEASGLKIRLREKGGRVRYLHCNSEILAPTLLRYLDSLDFSEGFLFRGYRVNQGFTEKQFGRQNCHDMIKRRCRRLNLGQNLSMHSFRASFGTNWLGKNFSIDSLQKIGGWANLDTVKRYDRNRQEASASEMEQMSIM